VEKEIIWANQAKHDLQQIYNFNCLVQDEDKAFKLIESLVKKTERLSHDVTGGTRYISNLNPRIHYQKLVFKHYLIIFRIQGSVVYILKIFDSRQNPKKLKL
jgi:plasmid stabilization system protein ParE